MGLSIADIIERDTYCVVHIQSEEELFMLSEVWSSLGGAELALDILRRYAAKADLCLELGFNVFTRRFDWTWGSKSCYFGANPEINIYTLNELVPSNYFGEIEPCEASVFDLFLEVVDDMGLLRSDSCG